MKQKAIVLMAVFKWYGLGMMEFSSPSQKELMLFLFLYTYFKTSTNSTITYKYDIFLLSHIIR